MNRPSNLVVADEPDWHIRAVSPDGKTHIIFVNNRCEWKRLSAICHARLYARRNPTYRVYVELA